MGWTEVLKAFFISIFLIYNLVSGSLFFVLRGTDTANVARPTPNERHFLHHTQHRRALPGSLLPRPTGLLPTLNGQRLFYFFIIFFMHIGRPHGCGLTADGGRREFGWEREDIFVWSGSPSYCWRAMAAAHWVHPALRGRTSDLIFQ